MYGKTIRFYLRNENTLVVSDLFYNDIKEVQESFDKKEAIHVAHLHIAPNEVLYYVVC